MRDERLLRGEGNHNARRGRSRCLGYSSVGWIVAAYGVVACGARTGLDESGSQALIESACTGSPSPCIRMPSSDPCSVQTVEGAVCDQATRVWVCKAGARPYQRAASGPAICLPFHGATSSIRQLSGSLTRVPTDDGRCLWIADQVQTDSETVPNVAFVPDPTAPFGTCPEDAPLLNGTARSAVVMEGSTDPSIVVQITGAYRMQGRTRVLYRLFRLDLGAVFGMTELGTGLGRWDATSGQIVVGNLAALRFATDLDLGDDSIVIGDYAFVWGCPLPSYLSRQCLLGRLDEADAMQLFIGGGQWSAGASASAGAVVFDAGPWISSVTTDAAHGGLLHIFAPDFGSELQVQSATAPEGPWTGPAPFATCNVPPGDAKAYCIGPVAHTELMDPTRSSEFVVSYSTATTASPAPLTHDAYWPRLAWISEN
jgi:hypothetical protein